MPRERRIVINGQPVPFSCKNKKYQTDVNKGQSHWNVPTLGSVTGQALITGDNGYTLWLEHVHSEYEPQEEFYWLMWYDSDGMPAVPMNSIFNRDQLTDMVRQLMRFVP